MYNNSLNNDLLTFAVARIRSKENALLSEQDLSNLMACSTYSECVQSLLDRGWGPTENDTPEELLALERTRMWELMGELLKGDSARILDIFRLEQDYHNLKAAIKESYIQQHAENIYMDGGTMDPEVIRQCAQEAEFGKLPAGMEYAAREAREILFQTGDSQLCDVIIDRACLEHLMETARKSENQLFIQYAEFRTAAADINIAIRASKAGKDEEFLRKAFAECSSISVPGLILACRNGLDQVYEFLEQTAYADAVDVIRESPAAFDRWCDNRMIRLIRPQKYNAFTVSPLAAYILAKECEIKSVRLILLGKLNHLEDDKIRERLRESYV